MIVVGDIVGDRRDLRLEAGPGAKLEVTFGIGFGQRPGRIGDRAIMLGETFERFPAQVEAVEIRVGIFQPGDDAQRMGIVVEPAGVGERGRQRILAGMAERRMAEVVGEAQSLGQIFVEAERAGHRPADLRDFEAVGQAHPEMVAVGGDEHLGLVAEAAEGDRVDDAVAVALEDVAGPARAGVGFGMEAAARLAWLSGDAWRKLHSVASGTILSESELVHLNASMPTV